MHSDATAAIGIRRCKGLGQVRHLGATDQWIQDKVRSRTIELVKILGTENPADVLTKYVDRASMLKAMATLGIIIMTGRPACAPAAMGIQES